MLLKLRRNFKKVGKVFLNNGIWRERLNPFQILAKTMNPKCINFYQNSLFGLNLYLVNKIQSLLVP